MIRWNFNLAYAIGLITTDGCLSKDKRHIILVSKDIEQLENFAKYLNLKNKISTHSSSYNPSGKYYHLQFGNVKLYRFLLSIGLTPAKSKTLGALKIPKKYFRDFLRGSLDGDGSISVAQHPESQYPQLRVRFCSASIDHLTWLRKTIRQYCTRIIGGYFDKIPSRATYLVFAKSDSIKLLEFIYYDKVEYFLQRKYTIAT